MDKKAQNILKYSFWIALAAVLVYFCLRAIDWKEFGAALQQCRWIYVVLAMLVGAAAQWFKGARWQLLLEPLDASASRITCFNAYNICMASNLVLPRAGELIRLGYAVKHSALDAQGKRVLGFDKVLGTAVVERSWDALVCLSMLAALLVIMWDSMSAFLQERLGGVNAMALAWTLAGLAILGLAFLLLSWLLRDKGLGKIWGFVRGIGAGLSSFAHMRGWWLFLLYTLLIWGCHWLTSAAIVWALQDIPAFSSLTLTDAFLLMVLGSSSAIIPVPGGFGAYHGLVAGALMSFWNIPLGTAMIYATLNHESQVVMQALCGVASYIHESFLRQ